MKKGIKYIGGIVITIVLVLAVISWYFINYALYNGDRKFDEAAKWEYMYDLYPQMKEWGDSVRSGAMMREWMVNENGDSIRMYIIPAQRQTQRTVVLAHGYKDNAISMMHLGYMYHRQLGYNVVAYDQYAHGASQGDMIQMGWKDRKNLIMCAGKAQEMYGDTIILHGISMGGATVMMASGDEALPQSVRVIVDDCGYTSVWDEYQGEIKNQFGLPAFPILHVTNIVSKLVLGWSFTEASSVDAVSRTQVPMLFIHGDNDTFVPTEMVNTVFQTHHGKKAKWLAPGSVHARSYHDYPDEYTQRVQDFVDSVFGESKK